MPVWLISIITHIGFKVTSIILGVSLVCLALFSWIKIHDSKVRAEALTHCPPQTVIAKGATANIYQGPKMRCFPAAIGHWGLGICHD